MLNHDALGGPCRPRRIHGVGESGLIDRCGGYRHCRYHLEIDITVLQDDGATRVLNHRTLSGRGIRRIHGNIAPARLERGEKRNYRGSSTRDLHSDWFLWLESSPQ